MKTLFKIVYILILMLSFTTANAQFGFGGNGMGNGRMNQMGGMGRMNQQQPMTPEKPKEIPVEVTVGQIMERLKPDLGLDALQEVAISNILTQSIKTQTAIIKQEISQDSKIKEIQTLSEITDSKVMVLLNSDQKEKYLLMKDEFKNPKKSKSDKKSKKEAKKEKETEE